jgi:hypothetical protein
MTRLDGGCKAKILHASEDKVLFTASWPASKHDTRNFIVTHGIAFNTVEVSRKYFERRYGAIA